MFVIPGCIFEIFLVAPSIVGATVDSEGRALEMATELTLRVVSGLLEVVGWVELVGTVIFESGIASIVLRDTETEGCSSSGI